MVKIASVRSRSNRRRRMTMIMRTWVKVRRRRRRRKKQEAQDRKPDKTDEEEARGNEVITGGRQGQAIEGS